MKRLPLDSYGLTLHHVVLQTEARMALKNLFP